MKEMALFIPYSPSGQMPSGCLVFGICFFFAAVVSTCTGKAWIVYHGWVYRTEEPIRFLGGSRNVLSLWCWLDWILLVELAP
jgi:hypothetical protein